MCNCLEEVRKNVIANNEGTYCLETKTKEQIMQAGCDLQKGWHVDHIQAIRRNDSDESIERMNKIRTIPLVRGQNSIENYNPACRQCNIWKSTYNIEQFRKEVAEQIKRLNDYNANYRNAKRYGLIVETNIEVKFHFETVCSNDC